MSSFSKLPATDNLLLERNDGVLRIVFNRPKFRNALSDDMLGEITQVLDAIHDDRTLRAIVVRGKGGLFCAGGDIKDFQADLQSEKTAQQVAASNRKFGKLMSKVNEQPQVTIMLVEGAAIGGGLGLACVGDVTIVCKGTQFRLSETRLGIPPAQIAPFVTARIGITQARRLMLTGAHFDAEEAVRIGVAHTLVDTADELETRCQEVLSQIKFCAPNANAMTKSIMFAADRRPLSEALDVAAEGFASCMLSDEGREGVSAFVEKRRPSWAPKKDN